MTHFTIDFVSDVTCPWCAIGLSSLQRALQRVSPGITAALTCQPFELNPQMWPGGQDVTEHLTQKYGSTPEQQAEIRDRIRARGAEVGFAFAPEGRGRVYNTFAAHRLLTWAQATAPQHQVPLKMALLQACHHDRAAMEDTEVLVAAALSVGLDAEQARAVLTSDAYSDEVRQQQAFYQRAGIHSVPAVIINQRHLVSGGQPVEVYEQVLRELAQAEPSPS